MRASMTLKFIGADGSMGLRYGELYECNVENDPPYVWVVVHMQDGDITCPYSSLRMLRNDWQKV